MRLVSALVIRAVIVAVIIAATTSGAVSAADSVAAVQVREDLRAADQARARAGAELQAWRLEAERLAISTAGLRAEVQRAEGEAAAAEQALAAAKQDQQALANGDTPARRLQSAAHDTRAALIAQAVHLPPGALVVPADDSPTAVLTALETSQHALANVTVELASGHRAGAPADERSAVRLLRVASLAWWLALDGREGGTAEQRDGRLELLPLDGAAVERIRHACAIAEGHAPAEAVVLPRPGVAP